MAVLTCLSCSNGIKRLTNLYEKKLSAPRGHLFSGSELFMYGDSTFEYREGGPALKYSRGRWKLNADKCSITLKSARHYKGSRQLLDTVFLQFDSTIVRIKRTKTVELNNQLFTYHD